MSDNPRRSARHPILSPEQVDQVQGIASRGPSALRRRARIIVLAHQGEPVRAIAAEVGLSRSGVWYWLRRFQRQGMTIFGTVLPAITKPLPADAAQGQSAALTLEALCRRYSVDMAHAEHVAGQAVYLFEATQVLHNLDVAACRLLKSAALVHNLAFEIDPANHHVIGRDILLQHPLDGFNQEEQAMLACLTVFHRKKVKPDRETAYTGLPHDKQQTVLTLAALLRVADGLDYTQSQTTQVVDIRLSQERVILVVEGRYADLNGARAERMGDLWLSRFGLPVQVWEHHPADAVRGDVVWARLESDFTLAEAGRILMGHYLMLVEQHAEQLREGRQEMLPFLERDVARLHGAFKVFGSYFDASALGTFKKDARWINHLASEALTYQAVAVLTRVDEPAPSVVPAINEALMRYFRKISALRQSEAEDALNRLLKALDSRRYRRFLTELVNFTRQTGAGVFPGKQPEQPIGPQVALMIWQEFNRLRTEAGDRDGAEAQWRLVARLYNLLQFLGSLLGEELHDVQMTLQPLEAQLRDIMLGEAVLSSFAALPSPGSDAEVEQVPSGVEQLIAIQQAWLNQAYAQLEPLWVRLNSREFRRQLALAIAEF